MDRFEQLKAEMSKVISDLGIFDNDTQTRSLIHDKLDAILAQYQKANRVTTFLVECSSINNTPQSIAAGELRADVYFGYMQEDGTEGLKQIEMIIVTTGYSFDSL